MKSVEQYHRKRSAKVAILTSVALVVFFAAAFFAVDADAMPFFSRQTGKDCSYCHSVFPKLNEIGLMFRSNGYRIEGEGFQLKDVKDWTTLPASVEAEASVNYSKVRASGVKAESSDIKLEKVELSAGGAMGKTGLVSVLGAISAEQNTDGTSKVNIHKAFVQVNDLAGGEGRGVVNVRAGQWELGLPFMSPTETVFKNLYLAERALNIFTSDQRAIEVNGSIVPPDETKAPIHRYSLGISRENTVSPNAIRGVYLTYSATILEHYNIGAIYRGGKENFGGKDVTFNKYGAGAEAELGPVIASLGLFKADRSGSNPNTSDFVIEALYRPIQKLSLGARYDRAKLSGKKAVNAETVLVRCDILSNVAAQVELTALSDKNHTITVPAANPNERERTATLFLTAIF